MIAMQKILTVARRELKDLTSQRWIVAAGVLLAGFFMVLSAVRLKTVKAEALVGEFNSSLFYLALTMGIFVAYLYSGQSFLREKTEGVIETLMAAPISLRSLWLGKVIGVAVLAEVVVLTASAIFVCVAQVVTEPTVVPSPVVVAHLLVGVPGFILAAVGLLGFTQLVLGMRENHIVNLLVFFLLFFAITVTQTVLPNAEGVGWTHLGTLVGFAAVLLILSGWLSKYLSRERIVRTIP